MRKLVKDGRFEMRIESDKLKLLEAIAKHLESDRSNVSQELISIFVDNYDQLFDIATEKKITVFQLMRYVIDDFIVRKDKLLTVKITV